ncbi:MAG: aquaporin [Fimbriimonadaceae bacterium]|nr:aquaporin [Fimbriimonadaceae bacterium]
MPKYLTEFVGTFLFLFTIALAVFSASPVAALAIGVMLTALVYMGGHISGGHYNPAVSLALALAGKFKWADLIPYWISQTLGAIGGTAVAQLVTESTPSIKPGDLPIQVPLIVETLFTLALCLVVLNIATHSKTKGNYAYGMAIGLTVVAAAVAGGGISGGAFNPAVGTGMSFFMTDKSHLWLYWAGPMIGAILAAVIFKVQEMEPTES